jgi:hypothetical protein
MTNSTDLEGLKAAGITTALRVKNPALVFSPPPETYTREITQLSVGGYTYNINPLSVNRGDQVTIIIAIARAEQEQK